MSQHITTNPIIVNNQFVNNLFTHHGFIEQINQLISKNQITLQQQLKNKGQLVNGQHSIYCLDQSAVIEKNIDVDQLTKQINQLLVKNYKETICKQSNQIYTQIIKVVNDVEEIKSKIQNMERYSNNKIQMEDMMNTKNRTESTPEKQYRRDKNKHNEDKNQEQQSTTRTKMNTSLLLDADSDYLIQNIRKADYQNNINSLSFINSFCAENAQQLSSINKGDQLQLKINQSITKFENSVQQRISNVQKNFARRVEQVMKTMNNLLSMMEETGYFCQAGSQSPKKTVSNINPIKKNIVKDQQVFITPKKITEQSEQPQIVNKNNNITNKFHVNNNNNIGNNKKSILNNSVIVNTNLNNSNNSNNSHNNNNNNNSFNKSNSNSNINSFLNKSQKQFTSFFKRSN